LIPIDIEWQLIDIAQQSKKFALIPEFEKGNYFRKDEIIDNNQIFID
jgi:hypothetical protein